MSAGFGFSVGDIIAGLKVIKTAIDALKESKGAASEFQALVQEIESLKDGLDSLADLERDGCLEKNSKQQLAIRNAASRFRSCIDSFMARVAKYQPWLQLRPVLGPGAWKGCVAKIRWAVCKKEDVARFRAQLAGHGSSIKMLLLTLQVNQSFLTSEKQKDTNTAIESLQETSVALRSDMTSGVQFLESLSHEQRSFFETMMRSSQRLMQENASMARELRELSTMMKTQQSIPPQVLLTKPVTLLDACGKISAFHLDFINSADAFIAVMKVRFKHEGVTHTGIKMVEDTQFVLNDYRGSLPMSKPWNQIMKPNQKVNMSMIFRRTVQPSACPVCESQCEGSGEGTECTECGLFYRHVLEKVPLSPHRSVHSKRLRSHSSADRESIGFSSESEIAYEDVLEQFRRVHIVSRAHTLQVKPKFKLPASDMTIVSLRLPFPIRCWTCGWSNIIPSGTVWNDLIKKPTGIFDGKTRSIIRNRHDCGQWIELETIEHPFKTSFNVIAGGVAVFGLEYDRAHSKEVNTFKSAHERSQSSSELFQGEIDDDSSGYRVFPGSTWRDNVSVTGQLKNYPTFFAKPKPSENIPTPASPRNSSPLSAVPVRVSSGPNPIADMAPNVEQPLASFKHGLISPQSQSSSEETSLKNNMSERKPGHAKNPNIGSNTSTNALGPSHNHSIINTPIIDARSMSTLAGLNNSSRAGSSQPRASTRTTPRDLPTLEFLFAGQLHSAIEDYVDKRRTGS